MEVSGLRLGALTAGRLTYGRRVRLRTADAENFHVNIPLQGRAASRRGAGEAVTTRPGEGLVFSPGQPAEISWSADCEQLCLMVPRGRLEAELEQLLGQVAEGSAHLRLRRRPAEPPGPALADGAGPARRTSSTSPTDVSRQPPGRPTPRGPGARRPPARPATQPSRRGAPGTARAGTALGDQASRRADRGRPVGALDDGAPRRRGAPQRARAAGGVPSRSRHAADDLPAPGPAAPGARGAGRRPTATPPRCVPSPLGLGILHLSRFAAAYREAFGETPSDTLARHT